MGWLVLIAGIVLARLLGAPWITVAAATGVSFWYGYDAGKGVSVGQAWDVGENFPSLLFLGFMCTLLGVMALLMKMEERKGRQPPVPSVYALLLLAFTVVGFGAGALATNLIGPLPQTSVGSQSQ